MTDLFRGFIPMGGNDGKRALMKFKDVKDLPSREDAARHDAYAGVRSEKIVDCTGVELGVQA